MGKGKWVNWVSAKILISCLVTPSRMSPVGSISWRLHTFHRNSLQTFCRHDRHNTSSYFSVRENVCNNSKKRKTSCFLDFQENVKKRLYNFSWLFNVYCSSSLLSESDIVHTRCSAMAPNGSHSRIWEMNYSDH